jgi:hypothetical protein
LMSCGVGSILDPDATNRRGSLWDRVAMRSLLSEAQKKRFACHQRSVIEAFQDRF